MERIRVHPFASSVVWADADLCVGTRGCPVEASGAVSTGLFCFLRIPAPRGPGVWEVPGSLHPRAAPSPAPVKYNRVRRNQNFSSL